jgi:hypothetical protein
MRGERFDRLICTGYQGGGQWCYVCDCGTVGQANGADIRRGKVRSCGCLQLEVAKSGDCRRTHGGAGTPEYRTWTSMLRRCSDPSAFGYHRYGGRGIRVCERWQFFENFLADMGPRPKGRTIDRRDVNGDYEPGNCRWATPLEQGQNTSSVVLSSANGKTQCLEAWARELGVSTAAIRYRLKRGMSHEDVINMPYRKHIKW